MPYRSINKLLKPRTLKIGFLSPEVYANAKAYKYLCPISECCNSHSHYLK